MPARTTRPRIGAIRVGVFVAAALPMVWLVAAPFAGWLGAEPVEKLQRVSGLSALSLLLATLTVTPLRRLSGWNELIRLRRMLGLWAFAYASVHATAYFVFDQSLSPALIAEDVAEHPWVTMGFLALVLLVPLAVTSTKGWVRRLGGRRWNRLHRLIYPAAIAAALHFLWAVKLDRRTPLIFAVALVVLLAARVRLRAPRGGVPETSA